MTDVGLIESAIERPYSGYHRHLANKCAALLHSMVKNHGFIDGNKRTAWLLIELLIDRSRYELDIPDNWPVDDLVVSVAIGSIGYDELVTWFKDRLVRKG